MEQITIYGNITTPGRRCQEKKMSPFVPVGPASKKCPEWQQLATVRINGHESRMRIQTSIQKGQ
jgi:hypothetical protein